MYGQTEASPRIACLPPERLSEKLGSVGPALAGGELSIRGWDGSELGTGEIGEIMYRGPNVMMGYAECRVDLALGHSNGGVLATGDLGYLDEEGYLYLTGRSKRICKLAGARASLDEVERIAAEIVGTEGEVAAVDSGDAGVSIFARDLKGASTASLRQELACRLRVSRKLIGVYLVDAIPLLPNGKIDYVKMERLAGSERGPK
jgi:acyl-CoA synthetase (AMP-forming)/AMP-acid ligase II